MEETLFFLLQLVLEVFGQVILEVLAEFGLATFAGGAAFALGMALVRFVWAG